MPSKKIIILGVSCLIALGLISFGALYGKNPPKMAAKADTAPQVTPLAVLDATQELDSDHDGLKDWEEVLWKTDSHNPDTDGDGTNDGDEIKAGRNPNVHGPDDSLAEATSTLPVSVAAAKTDPNAPVTATEKLSQDIVNQYTAYKQVGALDSNDGVQSIANNLSVSAIASIKIDAAVYTMSDITTVPDSADALVSYGNAFGTILLSNKPSDKRNEIQIFQTSVEGQDEKGITALDPIINGYKIIIQGLLNTPVPQGLAALHLQAINDMSVVLSDIEGLRVVFFDPIYSFASLSQYPNNVTKMQTELKAINTYFSGQNISYQPGDPGYALIRTGQ